MKILVVRTDRIGDLIVSTPVFESLKKAYPGSHIAAMVSPFTKDLLKNSPFVDEVIVYDENGVHRGLSGLAGLAKELREKRFDVVVTLFSGFRPGLLAYLAGIPKRIAPATKIAQLFYNHRITQRRSRSLKHEADYNLDLLKGLGIENPAGKVGLWTDRESDLTAEDFLRKEGLLRVSEEGKIIGIHPGHAGSARNWMPERYAQLSDELISKYGYSVVLTGSAREKGLLDKVRSNMRNRPAVCMPDDLLSLASLLKKLKVFVSSSTGPMHMAAALNIPTVSLFCPIKGCSPVRWGPVGNRQRILMPYVPQCDKCVGSRCEYYDCMERITVGMTIQAVNDLAGEK